MVCHSFLHIWTVRLRGTAVSTQNCVEIAQKLRGIASCTLRLCRGGPARLSIDLTLQMAQNFFMHTFLYVSVCETGAVRVVTRCSVLQRRRGTWLCRWRTPLYLPVCETGAVRLISHTPFYVAEVARHGWFATDKELMVRCASCRENLSLALPAHDSGVRQACIGRTTGPTSQILDFY